MSLLSRLIFGDLVRARTDKPYNPHNPNSADTNDRFSAIGKRLGIEMPRYFVSGMPYNQSHVNENLDAINDALRRRSNAAFGLCVMGAVGGKSKPDRGEV